MDIDLRTNSFVPKNKSDMNEISKRGRDELKNQMEQQILYDTQAQIDVQGATEEKELITKGVYQGIIDAVTKNKTIRDIFNMNSKQIEQLQLNKKDIDEIKSVIPKIEKRIENIKDPEYIGPLNSRLDEITDMINATLIEKGYQEAKVENEAGPSKYTIQVDEEEPEYDEEEEEEPVASRTRSKKKITPDEPAPDYEEEIKPLPQNEQEQKNLRQMYYEENLDPDDEDFDEEGYAGQHGYGLKEEYEKSKPKLLKSKVVKITDDESLYEKALIGKSYGNVKFTKLNLHNGSGRKSTIIGLIDSKDGVYEVEFKLGKQVVHAFVTGDNSSLTKQQKTFFNNFINDLESYQTKNVSSVKLKSKAQLRAPVNKKKQPIKEVDDNESVDYLVNDLNRDFTMYINGNKSRILRNLIERKITKLFEQGIIDDIEADRLLNLL